MQLFPAPYWYKYRRKLSDTSAELCFWLDLDYVIHFRCEYLRDYGYFDGDF